PGSTREFDKVFGRCRDAEIIDGSGNNDRVGLLAQLREAFGVRIAIGCAAVAKRQWMIAEVDVLDGFAEFNEPLAGRLGEDAAPAAGVETTRKEQDHGSSIERESPRATTRGLRRAAGRT